MAGPDDTDDNRKVKDLLDPAARAELERWFGLPSFEQVADGSAKLAPPPDDPAIAEYHKRVAEALAAVDPVLLAGYERRMELAGAMIKPVPPHVVPTIGLLDLAMIARTVADPRDYERSPDVEDHLSECTPQALLRDLHRPDLSFDKVFEIDPDAARRFDGISMVEQAMATDWRLRQFLPLAFHHGRIAFDELRAERRQPWAELKLPSRSVTE
ncbi:MAG: hypothetical protein ABIY55_35445 [Kofleriaceae bacterium]